MCPWAGWQTAELSQKPREEVRTQRGGFGRLLPLSALQTPLSLSFPLGDCVCFVHLFRGFFTVTCVPQQPQEGPCSGKSPAPPLPRSGVSPPRTCTRLERHPAPPRKKKLRPSKVRWCPSPPTAHSAGHGACAHAQRPSWHTLWAHRVGERHLGQPPRGRGC